LSKINFFEELLTLPCPPDEHPLRNLWNPETTVSDFQRAYLSGMCGSYNPYGNGMIQHTLRFKKSMCGSFNPYGNGQPLTKQQYMTANAKAFANLSVSAKEAKWKSYLNRQGKGSKKVRVSPATNMTKNNASNELKKLKTISSGQNINIKGGAMSLSLCARVYATYLICPFYLLDGECPKRANLKIPNTVNPCIPSFPNVKTRKFCSFVRGSFNVQTVTGHGFLMFSPRRLANNGSTADDISCSVIYSSAGGTIANNYFPVVDTGAAVSGGITPTSLNTDYTTSQLIVNAYGQGVKYRVVAAGFRLRYTGNFTLQSGVLHFVQEPDHGSLSNQNIDAFGKFESYYSDAVKQDTWHSMSYAPVNLEEFNLDRDAISNATLTDQNNFHFMGVLIAGAPTNASFQYEVITHFEAVGNIVRGKTDTPSDPVGLAAVQNSVKPDINALLIVMFQLQLLLTKGHPN